MFDNYTLQDWAALATIIALPVMVLIWLVDPKATRVFLHKHAKSYLYSVIAGLLFLAHYKFGILDFLFFSITVKLWVLIGISLLLIMLIYVVQGFWKGDIISDIPSDDNTVLTPLQSLTTSTLGRYPL